MDGSFRSQFMKTHDIQTEYFEYSPRQNEKNPRMQENLCLGARHSNAIDTTYDWEFQAKSIL